MREQYIPEPHQNFGTAHIQKHRGTGLFKEMGLGKTVTTLTAFLEMRKRGDAKRALVIAPLRVARDTWPDEIDKWEHTYSLKVSKILGTQKERLAAIKEDADIYTINCENVPWLVAEMGGRWKWDFLVIDELSKFKSPKSRRFKALRMIMPKIKHVTGLTGTPRPNGLLDLWSQLFLLDQGERLCKTLGQYKLQYFNPDKMNGHIVYSYKVKKPDKAEALLLGDEIYAQEIYDKISDICISMRTKDYAQMPDKVIKTMYIKLSQEVYNAYVGFEKELIMEIADAAVTVANAAVLTGKLLQFANGAIYDDKKKWHNLHDEKLDALEDIVEDAQGEPILIFYNFKHDVERITARLKGYKPRVLNSSQDLKDWNDGKILVALAHPASAGHGLNLQAGGRMIVWFGLPWSLELYQQANARLHRRGQKGIVIVHHLLTAGTMEEDVLKSLTSKDTGQRGAMRALKAKVEYYKQGNHE